jgi:hypothetical protein
MSKYTPNPLSSFQSAGQNINSALSLVNVVDAAADALGADAKTRKELKQGLMVGACALAVILLIKKLTD